MITQHRPSAMELKFAKFQFGYEERVELYQQLASLVATGMPKTDAIQQSWDVASLEGKKPKELKALVIYDIKRSMLNGKSLAEALRPWVPKEDVMIFEAIENTEDFAGNLMDHIEMTEKKRAIRNTIIGGSIYPLMLFGMVYFILNYFGAKVVPTISQTLPIEKWTGPAQFLAFMATFAEFYAVPFLVGVVGISTAVIMSLSRWHGWGRIVADKFPIYSTYRMYTGISFLLSMASLIQSGMHATDALNKLHPSATPYAKSRILRVRNQMLNGANFGAALYRAKTGWPDTRMNLNIKIFAETQDLSKQLTKLSKGWVHQSHTNIQKTMAVLRTVAMLAVFAMIMAIVAGIYSLQEQIGAAANAM